MFVLVRWYYLQDLLRKLDVFPLALQETSIGFDLLFLLGSF